MVQRNGRLTAGAYQPAAKGRRPRYSCEQALSIFFGRQSMGCIRNSLVRENGLCQIFRASLTIPLSIYLEDFSPPCLSQEFVTNFSRCYSIWHCFCIVILVLLMLLFWMLAGVGRRVVGWELLLGTKYKSVLINVRFRNRWSLSSCWD